MDTQPQRVVIEIWRPDITHSNAVTIVTALDNFTPDEPVRSIGGYGSFRFFGTATGDIQLQDGMMVYDNEDLDLTNPKNFSRLVKEELATRKSGLALTGKSREERDDQFFFESVARRKAKAVRNGESHVYLASIGSWDMIFKNYGKKATFIDRRMARHSEKGRVRFITKYALPDWQKFLLRYFKKAGENPTPKYYSETFTTDLAGTQKEITIVGYSLVLQL